MQQQPSSRFRSLDDPTSLRELARRLQEGIYITNASGQILDANPALLDMLGLNTVDDARRLRVDDLLVDPKRREEEVLLLEQQGAVREFEFWIVRPADGQLRAVVDTAYRLTDDQTGEVFFHGMLVDITKRKEMELQLLEQSQRDPLTGLYNRRYLAELQRTVDAQGEAATWGVIYIDVNHFKMYNDRYGHQAGDNVLVKMSRFLLGQVRAEEAVVRVGGDEFVVILTGADVERTHGVALRLQAAALHSAPVPFSLGWASRAPNETLESTIARADSELMAVRVIERAPVRRVADQRVAVGPQIVTRTPTPRRRQR